MKLILFSSNKKEVPLEKFIEIVYFIAMKKLDYSMMHLIQVFVHNQTLETLSSEKIMISIQGFFFFKFYLFIYLWL